MVSSTAVFTKAKHSHLRLISSSFQYHHKLKEVPRPHLLMHYFTDPSSANPRRHVTVMQCFTRQPNRSPRPLSQYFSQKSEGILYIWAVYISDLLVIVRYFASFTSNQGLVMRSLHFFFSFFFFVWCLGFRIWFNCINSWWWVFNLWWWSLLLCFFFSLFDVWVSIWFDLLKLVVMDFQPVVNLCFSIFLFSFFLCLMFGFVHLVCTILMLGVMGFQPVVMKFTSLTSGFSTCSDLVK